MLVNGLRTQEGQSVYPAGTTVKTIRALGHTRGEASGFVASERVDRWVISPGYSRSD
jgi:hypothetical protein